MGSFCGFLRIAQAGPLPLNNKTIAKHCEWVNEQGCKVTMISYRNALNLRTSHPRVWELKGSRKAERKCVGWCVVVDEENGVAATKTTLPPVRPPPRQVWIRPSLGTGFGHIRYDMNLSIEQEMRILFPRKLVKCDFRGLSIAESRRHILPWPRDS